MSEFEFFTVAISIILALGIGRLLDGVAPALDSGRRYWVHVGWIAHKLMNHILWWWGLWAGRGIEWNLAMFIWSLLGPIVLYLQAAALVTSAPSLVTSWRERFFEIRPWFFAGNFALCVILVVGRSFSEDVMIAPVSIGLALLALLAVVGMATDKPRIHAGIIVCALIIQTLGLSAAMFQAGQI